jgi:transposase
MGSAEELERRRTRAMQALKEGQSPSTIARVLGVHVNSVRRWRRMAEAPDGLKARPHPGPNHGLSDEQLQKLETLLQKGAKHHGWHNQLWTAARVAALIRRHFGISYHPEHVRKILKARLGWTSQKPKRKARERDDKEVERWKDDDFRRIVREAFVRKAHVVFLDESGFQLNPSVRRTLAPRGKTPVLDAWDRRDRISAISCVSLSPVLARPGLYFELMPLNKTVHAEQVVEFLEGLRRRLRGPFTVIWDRHKIHSKAKAVKAYLALHPEIAAEDLPPYAPYENPDEWVWSWAKYGKLANLAAQDGDELYDWAFDALAELKSRPDLLDSFVHDAELPIDPYPDEH